MTDRRPRTRRLLFLGLAALALALGWRILGSGAPPAPTAAEIARAAELRPQSAALNEIYERSCITCHATPDAQAPLTGHAPSWAPRLREKGLDGLAVSALYGFGNMPAMGLCPDCTEAELAALITFMSTPGDAQ